jgi:hypothetical protein
MLLLCSSLKCWAADFAFEVPSPKFKVTLPNIPQLRMDVHPMNASRPDLRFLGSEGPYTVSIMTPTADSGMTALECASSMLRTLSQRPGVPQQDQVYRARINDNTYVAIYASKIPGAVHLHAHFMSAVAGTHCVEVHASKISTSPDDLDAWFKGFGKANIEVQ